MDAAAVASAVFRQVSDAPGQAVLYVAVPGNERARWLLPAVSAALGNVLDSWSPYRRMAKLAWGGVRAAAQAGCLASLPGATVLQVEGAAPTGWRALGWAGDAPPVPVLYLGTPGPRRKAVIHLVEAGTSQCRAVVKVPLTEAARAAILREAEVLRNLEGDGYSRCPRLVRFDAERGIATQSFLPGFSGPRQLTEEGWRLLESLALPGKSTSLTEHAAAWRQSWNAEDGMDSAMAAAMAVADDASRLPEFRQHGDFAPWNVRRLPTGAWALVDWEEAQPGGLPLQDAYHFLHIQDFLFEGRPRRHADEIAPWAGEFGLDRSLCLKLELAYLLDALMKCRTGHPERARFLHATLELYGRFHHG